MSKTKGCTVDGLTFPTLHVAVQDITDWRWYAGRDKNGQPRLVRRLGDRVAEIRWDGEWWRWEILDEGHSVLMRGRGGRLTEALVRAEAVQLYQNAPCPAWCGVDHNTDRVCEDSRFHWASDELTVGAGRHKATVGTSCLSSPDPQEDYGPYVYVGGLGDCDLTVTEAEVLRTALAQAIKRAQEAERVRDHDWEQQRQSRERQRTRPDLPSHASPLVGEDLRRGQAA